MSILALIMSVSAPAFVATQKLNRQNQASATTLSYAEKYIDEFRGVLASKSADGQLPLCSDVISSFEVIQKNGSENDWWGIPTQSAAGSLEIYRTISNQDHDQSNDDAVPNWFQVRFDQQTQSFDSADAFPMTADEARVGTLNELTKMVCTPDDESKLSGMLSFRVTAKSNVNSEDGRYGATTVLNTLGAVRYK
ncbi:hypothetical protein [Pseudoclavibacter sp. CFCC 11306]|uniref:hypothetical protein n=1 Tax=Pseudoclavibacter sp. CFCC 11306 TaxID=1564493 RepID=UPI0013018DA0|nr:hypothetical protein [Pseudoclavibacter sp. CFCC 11306]KAB1658852.1 hypothetical protein F8O09_04575 [Pseudoclavibacter sp. CFCC 11306]